MIYLNLYCKDSTKMALIFLKKYLQSSSINYLLIDNLLPNEIASKLSLDFPKEKELTHLNGPQENKYVGIHFSDKQKLIEECIYAFQEKIVKKLERSQI